MDSFLYRLKRRHLLPVIFVVAGFLVVGEADTRELSLSEALAIATERSSRGEIIEGDLEVAQQSYDAERINFYIPEISINGQLPVYNVSESFRFFGGLDSKELIRTTDRDFRTFIQLDQSLITGGQVTATGNLWNRKSEYPGIAADVIEISNQGIFDFSFQQPLLKPSEPKNNLRNKGDDLEIARLTREEERASLKTEVTEAYFGVVQSQLQLEITGCKAESAQLKGDIDSVKFLDGVVSEETWLETKSARLDAELDTYDMESQLAEKNRELTLLLDLDVNEGISTSIPEVTAHVEESEKQTLIAQWEESVPVRKAWHEYRKAERQANYTASSHGLTGTFEANYSLGRGDVDVDGLVTDNNTDSWGVTLNFTLPLWDGGSTGAAIKAARLTAQKAELEHQRVRKSARAEIIALLHRLDVGYRKLEVMKQQIAIAKDKLEIAEFRYEDGQISKIEYLDSKVFYLETQTRYLEELQKYRMDRIEIEGKYLG